MTWTGRAGAIAAAAMIFVTLFGARATGAWAETATATAPAPAPSEAAADEPRFYAEEIVQPLLEAPASDASAQ